MTQLTPAVRNVLSWYDGERPGVKASLARLLMHGRMGGSGKLVIFMSEQIPHEVLPTRKPRASIAGWFRCNASVTGKIDPAR